MDARQKAITKAHHVTDELKTKHEKQQRAITKTL
jgi:hypothetical protein